MFDLDRIGSAYEVLESRVTAGRELLGRPLTLAEKILLAHLAQPLAAPPERQETYVYLQPDRVALQDATAQMALLQFMSAGRARTAVPATVHCDHLIQAQVGADLDLVTARGTNREVYDFLRIVSQKYGLGFWKPGSGIIHQVILENYAFPGGLMIGTDSHTPNAGGLGMLAIGVGGADAVDVMAGMPWELRWPGLIGVRLTGELGGWTAPKDVILKLAGILTVKGGTGRIVEYFGPGTASVSATGKATITNMGAEIGATCSLFPYDRRMAAYLEHTGRKAVVELAAAREEFLVADPEVQQDPQSYYDQVIEIDLTRLEPHVTGPYTPDLTRPISELRTAVETEGYVDELSAGLVGSCTNSSYEDLERASHVARQALDLGLVSQTPLLISPGSEQIRATVQRDGQLEALTKLGGTVLANACGPCIGQWKREDGKAGQSNSILTSFNRNFARRNDGNPATQSFLASPEIVTALSIAGRLSFNPLSDTLTTTEGTEVHLQPPRGRDLPERGFDPGQAGYLAPPEDGEGIEISIDPGSERLQVLEPFPPWDGQDMIDLPVLLKVRGKCTTDHISPAGPWLRYRGHLDNLSQNLFSGAENAFTGQTGRGTNVVTGDKGLEFHQVARDYQQRGLGWVVVGDENYGEGSSREQAAMEPRYLGCRAVITRSFARIHETNLKKQGILPLTFSDPTDYHRIGEEDRLSIRGLDALAPGGEVTIEVTHPDGSRENFTVEHSFSALQLEWFQAGSALNYIARQA